MTSAHHIVRHVLGTSFRDLPAAAIERAKVFILDTVGVGIAGVNATHAAEIRQVAGAWGVGDEAHVLGVAQKLPRASAAFVNGFQIHCQEFDCVHEPAVVHPMATIFATLLADAEGRKISGAEFIVALCVAVDVATTLGVATSTGIRFFRPATAGIFGATCGAARLRGFDEQRTLNALGYALAFASGTMQAHVEGKPALPVQIGNAARGAIAACDLAAAGLAGPNDVFDGPFGYLPLFEEKSDLAPHLGLLGKRWRIEEVSHKPFPTGRAAQGGIVAVQTLREQGVAADNLLSLALKAPPLIARLVGRPYKDDMAPGYARLCFTYCGAVALQTGAVNLDDFSGEKLADPEIAALAQRISVEEDGSDDPSAFCPQIATAELQDGRRLEARIEALYGSPANPMATEAYVAKFRQCVQFGGGGVAMADKLIDFIDSLEERADAGRLATLAAIDGA